MKILSLTLFRDTRGILDLIIHTDPLINYTVNRL
jgi:hypothetical protein